MSTGKWKPREAGPPEYRSRNPTRDKLEAAAAQALDRAERYELLAAQERTNAVIFGRFATRLAGKRHLRVLPPIEPEHDEAA